MPVLNVYLDKEVYNATMAEAEKDFDSKGRPSPSRVVQKALKMYLEGGLK